jgi:hypothetical protein
MGERTCSHADGRRPRGRSAGSVGRGPPGGPVRATLPVCRSENGRRIRARSAHPPDLPLEGPQAGSPIRILDGRWPTLPSYRGIAISMASRRRPSLRVGYNPESALARPKRSGPRSCSATKSARGRRRHGRIPVRSLPAPGPSGNHLPPTALPLPAGGPGKGSPTVPLIPLEPSACLSMMGSRCRSRKWGPGCFTGTSPLGKAGRLGEPPRQPPVRPRGHREREEAAAMGGEVAEETEGATPCRRHEPEFSWRGGPRAGCAAARWLSPGQSTCPGHLS